MFLQQRYFSTVRFKKFSFISGADLRTCSVLVMCSRAANLVLARANERAMLGMSAFKYDSLCVREMVHASLSTYYNN